MEHGLVSGRLPCGENASAYRACAYTKKHLPVLHIGICWYLYLTNTSIWRGLPVELTILAHLREKLKRKRSLIRNIHPQLVVCLFELCKTRVTGK